MEKEGGTGYVSEQKWKWGGKYLIVNSFIIVDEEDGWQKGDKVDITITRAEIKFEPIDTNGDMMTLKHWLECVDSGGFIDYDGFGYYAFEDKMSDKEVKPSHVKKNGIDDKFTHVVWYNR